MAYWVKRSESGRPGVKRIAREQLQAAVDALRGESGVSRERVHEARKRIKKVRALLAIGRAWGWPSVH